MEAGFVAVEIKQARRVATVDAKGLRGLANLLDRPMLGGLLISRDPEVRDLGNGVWAVPPAWILG
jgi:hypothetical protein